MFHHSKSNVSVQLHPDGNREIRSMTMVALPLPPLPLMVSQELEGEHSFVDPDHKMASSHDLIAHLMNVACAVASSSVNHSRMKKQTEVVDALFERVDAWQDEHDPEGSLSMVPDEAWCSNLIMEFTRLYTACYLSTSCPDLRFAQPSEIDRTHVVHKKALEFQLAQDVLYGPTIHSSKKLHEMTFSELLQHSIRRMLEARTLCK